MKQTINNSFSQSIINSFFVYHSGSNRNLEVWFLRIGENRSKKHLGEKGENRQQIQHTYVASYPRTVFMVLVGPYTFVKVGGGGGGGGHFPEPTED